MHLSANASVWINDIRLNNLCLCYQLSHILVFIKIVNIIKCFASNIPFYLERFTYYVIFNILCYTVEIYCVFFQNEKSIYFKNGSGCYCVARRASGLRDHHEKLDERKEKRGGGAEVEDERSCWGAKSEEGPWWGWKEDQWSKKSKSTCSGGKSANDRRAGVI